MPSAEPDYEAQISTAIRRFYTLVRRDDLIGPIFRAAVPDDHWDAHIEKIASFWHKVILGKQGYDGFPMRVHVMLPGLEAEHFERWLSLFSPSCRTACDSELAERMISKAEMMARSFRMGIAFYREQQAKAV